ncbi:tRNA1(Val) (adenine(37)-N6)-methyltransferase [Aestuariispira ectoiniformans]|uniref:tRNA1(Val) (adenine(37)-N6)-methyltransferase n=1 Tax=Aestuariispira ectoiniformans TaxID=2775080 RepID=UPI00223AD47B|nr:methyltransferase [Aestuariispira ectoiniformans]
MSAVPFETTQDDFLGGKLSICQPKVGYRAAMDPVLLAAAAPALRRGRVLDVGAGVGTAGLCYLARVPGPELVALELLPELAALAERNVAANGMDDRVTVVRGDLSQHRCGHVVPNSFDLVITNPPYMPGEAASPSPNAIRQTANVESHVPLAQWLDFCLKMLKQKGTLVIVQRADRLDDILAALHGRAGEVTVIPLWPKPGREAKRVLVRARKAVKGPARMTAGLTLHTDSERYTKKTTAILMHGASLEEALEIS